MKILKLSLLLFILAYSTAYSQTKCLNFHEHSEKNDRLLDDVVNLNPETGRPYYDKQKESDEGRFLIHYFTEGNHAPDMTDIDGNGHPDYIDSVAYYCELTYQIEIEDFGFRSPIPEPGGGSDAYDVYIYDLGNSIGTYGFNYPEKRVQTGNTFPQYYSFMVIDNDFSKTDSIGPVGYKRQTFFTHGYGALKVTLAHEFHHAVQNMYGIDNVTAFTFMEATSVLMEHLLFEDVPDYLQYVRQLFKSPDTMPFGYIGSSNTLGPYAYSIFMLYLVERFDVDIIKNMWENVLDGHNNFYALNLALNKRGYNVDAAWCEFREWCYFTGERSIEGQYFKYARDYPEIAFYQNEVYSSPSMNSASKMEAYEMRYYRCIFDNLGNVSDDTLDIMLGSYDIESARRNAGIDINYSMLITDQQITGSQPIEDLPYFFLLDDIDDKICHNLWLNKGSANVTIEDAYPNPYKSSQHQTIFFPAPNGAILYDEVLLSLYTTEMLPVFQQNMQVGSHNNHLVVPLHHLPDVVESGVHIFSIKYGDEFVLGKIAIVLDQ